MFNWTTTTILNSLKDITTGDDLIKVFFDKFKGASDSNPVLKIKRDKTFENRYVTSVYKAEAADPVLCKMTVNCAKLITAITALHTEDTWKDHARLSFYIALEGSEESIYANDMYQKGKPFSIGFDVTKTTKAADLAALIKKNAEKYGVVIYGKQVLKLTADGDNLVVEGTHEHQRIKVAFVAVDTVIDEEVVDAFSEADATTNATSGKKESDLGVFVLEERGANGFGTYTQLIKDLRLPTYANLQWNALHEDEKPVVGGHYNQYIITYCAPSMANPSLTMIGQHGNSITTHVFWVADGLTTEFEGFLTTAKLTITPAALKVAADANIGEKYAENHEQSETVSHKKTK